MTLAILVILALIANFLDYYTTIIAIHKYGMKEMNPLMRKLMKYPNAFFLLKVIFVSHLIIWSPRLSVIIVLIVFGACAINNFVRILIKKKQRRKNE